MGRNTHAIPYVLVVNANAVVPEIVEVARLPPGAPVVSISTYVELSTCGMGVALLEPVPLGVLEPLRVPVSVPVGVKEGELVSLVEVPLENDAVWEGVGEGEGNCTPCTYTDVPYAVPALITLSHIKVGNVDTAVPQYTLLNVRRP